MDIVLVGTCYLDTILTVPHFPDEDAKLRASTIKRRRGGNCLNSLDVMQQLVARRQRSENDQSSSGRRKAENRLHLISVLPNRNSRDTQQVIQSFGKDSPINFEHSIYREDATEAASCYIIQSKATGSRTLVNYKPLEEMTVEEFVNIAGQFNVKSESWWHFEGIIPEITLECIQILRRVLPNSKISVEVEKPGRQGLRELAAEADVIFYSKAWAEASGYDSAETCLKTEPRGRASLAICPWGAGGAFAMSHLSGDQIYCPVEQHPDEITVVDSVGAGDTFIAGMLYGLTYCNGYSLGQGESAWDTRRCVRFAVDLATLKVQRDGFAGLADDVMQP